MMNFIINFNFKRNFKFEILAGEDRTETSLKHLNCNFKFDFAKVYWNTRLSTEHERIVEKLTPGDILFDVFAGVGPFSVPASRRGVKVFANDLNPDSYFWLVENSRCNK